MKQKRIITYVLWILAVEVVGLLSGVLSMRGMADYNATVIKPDLTPPAILFPIVWTVLYALMGVSAARIWLSDPSAEQTKGMNLFVVQLFFNFFWSLIFFNAQAFGFAAIWLIAMWILTLLMTLFFHKVDKLAAYLQIPYLLWLTFALYLNVMVWLMNE